MQERWGSFSVADHRATDKLVTDVLTYDRLVFPFPPDEAERTLWGTSNWNPELLDKRLEQLGDRGIKVPWDQSRREVFSKSMQRVSALASDAETAIPRNAAYQMTRRILAQDERLVLPAGVSKVVVVAAYHSLEDLRTEFLLDGDTSDTKLLSVLVRNRIAQPAFSENPERALELAIELSREDEFQQNRRALYKWQEDSVKAELVPGRAMEDLEQLIARYNSLVEKANSKVSYRLIFTVLSVALTVAAPLVAGPLAAIPFAIAAASSGIQLARFATLDRSITIQPGEAAPAAMFHEVARL